MNEWIRRTELMRLPGMAFRFIATCRSLPHSFPSSSPASQPEMSPWISQPAVQCIDKCHMYAAISVLFVLCNCAAIGWHAIHPSIHWAFDSNRMIWCEKFKFPAAAAANGREFTCGILIDSIQGTSTIQRGTCCIIGSSTCLFTKCRWWWWWLRNK